MEDHVTSLDLDPDGQRMVTFDIYGYYVLTAVNSDDCLAHDKVGSGSCNWHLLLLLMMNSNPSKFRRLQSGSMESSQ